MESYKISCDAFFNMWTTVQGDLSFLPTRALPSSGRTLVPKIYVFSNVKYPESKRIKPNQNDILVFLNKAETVKYYTGHPHRIVYHRSPKLDYGVEIMDCLNRYVFDAGLASIPREFIEGLKAHYDWDYPIEDGKIRCMTTGYMVVKYMEHLYPSREIVLVNFGYGVEKSTYRCPWHNWKFEAEDLKQFRHLYLEEGRQ